jgi:hypothetical protein
VETTLSHRELKNLAIDIRKQVAGGELVSSIFEKFMATYGIELLDRVERIIIFQEVDDPNLAVSFIERHTNDLKSALMYIFQMCLAVTGKTTSAGLCFKSVLAAYVQKNGHEKTMDEYLEFLDGVIFKDFEVILRCHCPEHVVSDLRRGMIELLQVDPIKITGRWPVFDDQDFLSCFHPNEFWIGKVSRFINSGDFARAWDELRKANRGFFPAGFKQNNFDPKVRGAFWATEEAVKALVNDLYGQMLRHRVSFPENVHAGRCSRWRWARFGGRRQVLAPGFDVAYFSCCPAHERKMEIVEEYGCQVTPEGHKALLLGDYFLEVRNIRRRARNERQRV